ncbi:MAG: hypothetical protein ACJAUG_001663 [Halioglobus sp.]|jgi:uncharacterized protein (TIGR02118 family)
MNFCVRKREDVSVEEFHDYWLNTHGPLVKSHREALCIKKYVQNHTGFTSFGDMANDSRGMTPKYDGLAELWWDDLETLQSAIITAEGMRASAELIEDEARFIDLKTSTIFLSEAHVIFE